MVVTTGIVVGVGVGFYLLVSHLTAYVHPHRRATRRAERARLDDAEFSVAVAASLEVGLWAWHVETDEVWLNASCAAVLGAARGARLTLAAFLDAARGQAGARLGEAIERAVESGVAFDGELAIGPPGAPARWLSASVRHGADASGARLVFGLISDITARKCAELARLEQRRTLWQALRAATLGATADVFVHELRQSLAAVRGYAQGVIQLLDGGAPDRARVRQGLDAIVSATRIQAGAGDRANARVEAGEPRPTPLDLNEIVQSTVELLSDELCARGVACTTCLADELPVVLGNRVQLQAVLVTLITNACDEMRVVDPASRRLVLATSSNRDQVSLAVSDAGAGIPPSYRDHQFEPFAGTTPQGLGLGLVACRWVIRRHGGAIRAATTQAAGAVFDVSLPGRARESLGVE